MNMAHMMDLSEVYEKIRGAADKQGLLTFPGYIGDDFPSVWWQGDPDDWFSFLTIAKAEGIQTVYVGRAGLDEEDLQTLAEWVEESEGPGSSNGNRARIKEFERYIGCIGEVRVGWIKDGVAYLLQHRTEWYHEFLEFMAETEEEEEEEL
jgi:hypothetical protein